MSFLERLEKVNTLYALQVTILEKQQQQQQKNQNTELWQFLAARKHS